MTEKEEIEELFKQYGNEVLRMCFLYLKDRHWAEDALQETFVKVIRFYGKFNHKSSIKTWITKIAINVCKDMNKNRTAYEGDVQDVFWENLPDENGTLDFIEVENRMTLTPMIQDMEEEMRLCVILFYYQQMSTREIAKITGMKRSTVEFRLKEARRILKNSMGGEV